MAKTEATVTSGVKNWYIIFLFRNFWIWEMPVGDKNVIIFLKFRFLAFKVFHPPQVNEFTPPWDPPRTPPQDASGGTTGGFAPNYDGTRKRKAETNSRTPTGRRIFKKSIEFF